MDRRNFLQKLGIGGAAVAATVVGTEKIIAKKTKKKIKKIPNISEADIKYIKKRILEDAVDCDGGASDCNHYIARVSDLGFG